MSAVVMAVAGATTATIAATAAVVGAVGLVGGAIETRKAGKAQRKSMEIQQRQADIAAARSRYAAVRQARIQRGAMQQQAQAGGVGASSGVICGVAGLQSSLAGEIGASQTMQTLSRQASTFNQEAASAQSNAAIWGAVGGMGSSIFQSAGGVGAIAKN